MTIPALIEGQDAFEDVRDAIATILATETALQQAFATDAGEDSTDWEFRVFKERSNPLESFRDAVDDTPIVNVWFDSADIDGKASNTVERQRHTGTYNIDIVARGTSAADTDTGGHTQGDQAAMLAAHRIARLVRNILMAATYIRLGMTDTVWRRWVSTIKSFQPEQGASRVQQIAGARVVLMVEYNETAPTVDESNLMDEVGVTIYNEDSGEVMAELEWDNSTDEE